MALLTLGLNHQTAPVDIREKVAFAPEQMSQALSQLQKLPVVNESVIVSTCNRTEIYCETGQQDIEEITAWLSTFHGLSANELNPYLYQHDDHEVANHLFRVASGLDSLVLGEPQILGQLKTSYDQARQDNSINSVLDRLFQHSFSVAKRVRTDTDIGSNPVSVAFAAVDLSRQIFGDLSNLRALLIGAGETIELVARHLNSRHIGSMVIANRSVERASALAEQLGADAVQINAVPEQLVNADIVISSTASQLPILGKGAVERAIKARKHRPFLMVDIAVPRDIEPQVGELRDVYLYSVDDLREIVDENMRSRRNEARKADLIIDEGVDLYLSERRGLEAVDAVKEYRQMAEQLREIELQRALRALSRGDDPEQVISQLSRAITNKLIHAPTAGLKQASAEGRQDLLDSACRLLGIELREELADEVGDEALAAMDIGATDIDPSGRTLQ